MRTSGRQSSADSREQMTTRKTTLDLESNPREDGVDRYIGAIIAQKRVKMWQSSVCHRGMGRVWGSQDHEGNIQNHDV